VYTRTAQLDSRELVQPPPPRTLRILRVFLFLPTEEEAFPMDELAATLMKRYKLHAFESKGLETGFSLG
jgi:hypothetical protein